MGDSSIDVTAQLSFDCLIFQEPWKAGATWLAKGSVTQREWKESDGKEIKVNLVDGNEVIAVASVEVYFKACSLVLGNTRAIYSSFLFLDLSPVNMFTHLLLTSSDLMPSTQDAQCELHWHHNNLNLHHLHFHHLLLFFSISFIFIPPLSLSSYLVSVALVFLCSPPRIAPRPCSPRSFPSLVSVFHSSFRQERVVSGGSCAWRRQEQSGRQAEDIKISQGSGSSKRVAGGGEEKAKRPTCEQMTSKTCSFLTWLSWSEMMRGKTQEQGRQQAAGSTGTYEVRGGTKQTRSLGK
eukprot:411896-Hanusia_phi.AAC.1